MWQFVASLNPRALAERVAPVDHKVIHTICGLPPTGPRAGPVAAPAARACPIIGGTLSPPSVSHDTSRSTGPLRASAQPGLGPALQRAWLRRGPLACALWPLSLIYGALILGRRALYRAGLRRPEHPGVPVVVVGNLVAGGAGKTPVVMALVEHLRAQGWRPGVISRGYGRVTTGCREVLPADTARDVGDEPLLIRRRCGVPVFVAERRIEAARALRAAHPDTDILVADDGLQHLALARDLAIAVFDDRGTGNGWLLPAGPLREPWPMGTCAVDLVLHTGDRPAFEGHRASRRLAGHALDANGSRIALAELQDRHLVALAGIARPQAFFDMLRERGLALQQTLALPDHAGLDDLPLPGDDQATVLCTEKDAVKLFARFPEAGPRLLAVPLQFEPEPAFFQALDLRLRTLKAGRDPLPSPHGHTTA